MFQKADLIKQIKAMGILPTDTVLIHTSMRAIGEVEGGADICKGVGYFAGGAGGGFAAHAGGAEGFLDGVFADVEVAGELGDVAGVGFVGLYAELVEHVEDSGGESFCHLAGGDVHGVLAAHGGEDAV